MGKGPWDGGVTESPECAGPLEQPRVHVFCCTSAPPGFGGFLSSLQAPQSVHGSRILLRAVSDLGIRAAPCLFLQGAGDWWLLLHGGVGIEQLKGQAAKPAYFCVF